MVVVCAGWSCWETPSCWGNLVVVVSRGLGAASDSSPQLWCALGFNPSLPSITLCFHLSFGVLGAEVSSLQSTW